MTGLGRRTVTSPAPEAPNDRLDGQRHSAATTRSTPTRSHADAIKLILNGGDGQRHPDRQPGRRPVIGGDGGNDTAVHRAPATTPSSGTRATAATPSRARTGNDTMLFNGSNIAEKIDLSANGNRLRLTRDVGGITMDLDGVETGRLQRPRRRRHRHRQRPDRHRRRPASTSTWPARSAAPPATARPTVSSSTAPTATTRSGSSGTQRK